jgi:hypothetical protein
MSKSRTRNSINKSATRTGKNNDKNEVKGGGSKIKNQVGRSKQRHAASGDNNSTTT